MEAELSPLDHLFPEDALEFRVTEFPSQKVRGPDAVTVGSEGIGLEVIRSDFEVALQLFVSV